MSGRHYLMHYMGWREWNKPLGCIKERRVYRAELDCSEGVLEGIGGKAGKACSGQTIEGSYSSVGV